MTRCARTLVVGAGIGGLGAAIAFGQRGAAVDVVEIKPDASVYGVGINQPANSLRALRSLGVLEQVLSVGYVYDRCQFYDRYGNTIVEVLSGLGGDVPANCALTRADLARILLAAAEGAGAKVARSTTVLHLEQHEDSVTVHLSDGRSAEYDLVLACDGIKSPLRRKLFGDAHQPVFTGCSVWRVTVPRPESVTGGKVFQGEHSKAGLIPLSDELMYMFVVTREPGNPRFEPAEYLTLLKERTAEHSGLIGEIRDRLTADDDIIYSPLSEVLLPPPWHSGRVVVLGDAAHACAPHLTQGAGQALEDAVVLAEMLDRDKSFEQSMKDFTDRRYPRVKLVQDVSRGILQAEMSVTPENIGHALAGLRAHLVEQSAFVDAQLNQPA